MKKNFPFFMVKNSPWPIIMSFNLMNMLISIILWIYMKKYFLFTIMTINILMIKILWFRDIIRESTFQGNHTYFIKMMLKFSMIMFIISELFFFISFFWTFFHSSISPSIEINMMWPPKMIKIFNYTEIPLLNTFTLITSGFFITLSHLYFLNNNFLKSMKMLMFTIMLGLYFSMIQIIEYKNAYFCINDSIYGSIFFLSTGFHGIHVLIGTLMLIISFIRLYKNHFSLIHHINFELSIWYWHFVDVIWLFLYLFYYTLI
uniref:Cytochrome c oxidase subunit 3 n=1 Tax=Melipona scutellaris TaxID=263364 RepID=A0A0B4U3K5_9HYME|nr:cytochrome c oxidase subunit III [Melipona scutellaris]AJC00748.1 cytochrome c oxidase subunit III [Melipona scutellaris]